MMEVHVPKVLCDGEAAQAVTRVVEISGPGHRDAQHETLMCMSTTK